MKKNLKGAIIFITILIAISSCKEPADYGRIDKSESACQNCAVLHNTSTSEKITFVIEESCVYKGEPHAYKFEKTIGPQEEQFIGKYVDGVGTKWDYKIISAYVIKTQ